MPTQQQPKSKRCTGCNKTKPLSEFYTLYRKGKPVRNTDGRFWTPKRNIPFAKCKPCLSRYNSKIATKYSYHKKIANRLWHRIMGKMTQAFPGNNSVVREFGYTVHDALDHFAKQLGHPLTQRDLDTRRLKFIKPLWLLTERGITDPSNKLAQELFSLDNMKLVSRRKRPIRVVA